MAVTVCVDSKRSPASQATSVVQGTGTSALRLRMSRTFTGLHCTPPVALSGCGAWLHLGPLNSIDGSPIPRAPCQSEESEELRAKVYAWYIMSKRSMAHPCDPTAPPSLQDVAHPPASGVESR